MGTAAEAQTPTGAQPEQVQQLIKILEDPAVQTWLKSQSGELKSAAITPPPPNEPVMMEMPVELMDRRLAEISQHVEAVIAAIPRLPQEGTRAEGLIERDFGGYSVPQAILFFALFIMVGIAAEWLYRSAMWRPKLWLATFPIQRIADRLIGILATFGYGFGAWIAFLVGSHAVFLALPLPPLMRQFLLGYLIVASCVRGAMILLDCLLVPSGDETPLAKFRVTPISPEAARFWRNRLALAVGWFLFGWVTVHLLALLEFSLDARRAIAYALGLGLLAIAIEVIWKRPKPAAGSASSRRIRPRALQWLWTFYAVVLWGLWIAGMMPLLWFLLVATILPMAISISRRATAHVMRPPESSPVETSSFSVATACAERSIQAGLILSAILIIAWAWDVDLIAMTSGETMTMRLIRGALNAVLVLLAADFLWHIVGTVIDVKLDENKPPPHASDEEIGRSARLRTLLPILRNILLVTFIIVAVLMALSALGLEIGPLIAGAGVLGVAVGFGAQTVVKDIISGMFYLFDDAFRVGDYIQSGSHKGTVESFSLRSVRLRHQRGPIYTVPFGELGAVENMSRDWVIDKSVINVTYDTDLEQVRKIIKDIGRQLKENPEFAPKIIDTLKMQGVQEFGDYAIQIRMKLTTKPGEQFVIRRRAFAMIKMAFEEKGIRFATPTVQVAEGKHSVAAAAQQSLSIERAAADPA
ncbi:mechanosensitive ion channel domain-containing protein [Rhodoligotrophos appendicifer]|uniref:mechanosensitive ion channel domain-containing protein n=2 Tax=Rhodoligotrophos appendicifer TaxID=987056 RepID=UPI003D1EF6DD